MRVQGSTFLVAAGIVVSTVAVGSKGGEEIVLRKVGDRAYIADGYLVIQHQDYRCIHYQMAL